MKGTQMYSERVTVSESTSIRVGRYIRVHHPELALADCTGRAHDSLEKDDGIGLLHNEHLMPRDILDRLFRSRPRRKFVGVLWFRNAAREAKHGEWVLEVYGGEFTETMTALAGELTRESTVKVHVRLVAELAHWERFSGDY